MLHPCLLILHIRLCLIFCVCVYMYTSIFTGLIICMLRPLVPIQESECSLILPFLFIPFIFSYIYQCYAVSPMLWFQMYIYTSVFAPRLWVWTYLYPYRSVITAILWLWVYRSFFIAMVWFWVYIAVFSTILWLWLYVLVLCYIRSALILNIYIYQSFTAML